jgi:hypothetical protein
MDRMFAQVHHSAAGSLWRFRTELTALLVMAAGLWELAKAITLAWAVIILATVTVIVLTVPPSRRVVIRRAWCVLSRHRIQRACFETRMHTRSGRLPLVLRISPTEVGERALIWCRAGICAADFEAHAAEIAAACYARHAPHRGPQEVGPAGHRASRHPRPAPGHPLRPAPRPVSRPAYSRRIAPRGTQERLAAR